MLFRSLLGEQDRVDVREHTASRDGDACEELVELLIFAHGDDVRLVVVAGGVAGELKDLDVEGTRARW